MTNKKIIFKQGNWSIYKLAGKVWIEAKHLGFSQLYIHLHKIKKGKFPYCTMENHVANYPVSVNDFLFSKKDDIEFWRNL